MSLNVTPPPPPPVATPISPPPPGCQVRSIAFDFATKTDTVIDLVEWSASDSRFLWIDVEVTDATAALAWLSGIGLVDEALLRDALHHESTAHLNRFDRYLHLVVGTCIMDRGRIDRFEIDRVDIFIGERFTLTLHKGPVDFLERVRMGYRDDFLRFAQSPSFLTYELWDHLTEHYIAVQKTFEDRVEALQRNLVHDMDDSIFKRVSIVGSQLLNFRKVLLPARAVLSELSSRKTAFVSEATQPFLNTMVGTIDHVLQDALVDRDILTQSLNLHMSMVSHQTNRLMNKLTVVSVIFLPLSFLAGVYGMNFETLPELRWTHGYAVFWALALTIATSIIIVMRRLRLL